MFKKRLKKLVILFLLIQGGLYSNEFDITSDYTNNSYIEYINTKDSEKNINIANRNIFFINKGLINITYKDDDSLSAIVYKGNGINVKENFSNIKIENAGSLLGKTLLTSEENSITSHFSGNGVSYGSTLNKLKNSGLISGSSLLLNERGKTFTSYSGNGLTTINNSTIESIENSGLISGKANLKSGIIVNNSFSQADSSGNGISFRLNSEDVINIINSGSILGEIFLKGSNDYNYSLFSGNGINMRRPVKNIINKGVISGKGEISKETSSNHQNILHSGNGINSSNFINSIKNNGFIGGKTIVKGGIGNNISTYSGNGIVVRANFTNIENKGFISGDSTLEGGISNLSVSNPTNMGNSGNGIMIFNGNSTEKLDNIGNISGHAIVIPGEVKGIKEYSNISSSGIGIISSGPMGVIINNTGVIKGSQIAIGTSQTASIIKNYGILAGRELFSLTSELIQNESSYLQMDLIPSIMSNETNYGMYIKLKSEISPIYNKKTGKVQLDSDGDVIIESITEGSLNGNGNSGKIILNTVSKGNSSTNNLDSFNNVASDTTYSNYIINGAGIKSGVLTIEDNTVATLNNTVINAYKTAITLGGNSKLIATDSTFNGGGLKNENATIYGSGGINSVEILGNSFINGKIDLGDGDDSLIISTGTTINDDINGGNGTDKLVFKNSGTSDNINIFHKVENIEKISIESGNITLYETAKLSGVDEINIKAGSEVNVRIDTREKDVNETYTGNALYGNNIKITGDSSKYENVDADIFESSALKHENLAILNIITNGLGVNSSINFGKTEFLGINSDEKFDSIDDLWIKTDSLIDGVNSVIKDSNGNTLVTIKGERDLFSILKKPITPPVIDPKNPTIPSIVDPKKSIPQNMYPKLNEIYKGIYTSGDGNFNALRNILTLQTSDKSNYISEQTQLKSLLSYLKDIYVYTPYVFSSDTSMKSMRFFRNIVIDNNFKARDKEWMFLGGLTHTDGTREQTYYGKNYHGFDTGSYNKNIETAITGAYSQGEYGLSKTLSAGVIFGGNKSDTKISPSKVDGTSMYLGGYLKKDIENLRVISGIGVQYSEYDGDRYAPNKKYDANYSDKAFDIYLNGKYKYKIKENLYLEPYAQLAYAYVDQEEIKENDGPLSLNIKSKDFSLAESTIGVDIRKEVITKNAKHSAKGGVSYTRILDGAKEDKLTADFGGKEFDILVPHKTPNEIKVGVGYEVERNNGVIVGVKTDYSVPIDSDENGHKNKNKGEWRTGLTVGYRF